jgi:ribosomal protein S18 acetylase RimI-like enzyme
MAVKFSTRSASEDFIHAHLSRCDNSFVPPLSSRVDIGNYARKIASRAECFEAWENGELVGLIAVYCSAPDQDAAFITNLSVLSEYRGKGIASRLMYNCIAHLRGLGVARIELEVGEGNKAAIALYERHGFTINHQPGATKRMHTELRNEEQTKQRWSPKC